MAPSALDTPPTASHLLPQKPVDKTIFPDGIKTSGQHPPLYDQLRPYADFPKEISGGTVWKAEDYVDNPERWVHEFSPLEVGELSAAADKFIADGIPLTGISKVVPLDTSHSHYLYLSGEFHPPANTLCFIGIRSS
jgi:hypothetical protein